MLIKRFKIICCPSTQYVVMLTKCCYAKSLAINRVAVQFFGLLHL